MKAGRKPTLTFSEQVKLRSIQAAFGVNSPEEAQFWEQAKTSAKLRRAIKRGKCIKPKPRKYKCYKDAHNAANRAYYQRNKDKVSEKNRRCYENNTMRKMSSTRKSQYAFLERWGFFPSCWYYWTAKLKKGEITPGQLPKKFITIYTVYRKEGRL